MCLNRFREVQLRDEDSKSSVRESRRGDDGRRDRDERRNRERSPDRLTRHMRDSRERHGDNSCRSNRDREEDKWRKRPQRDDEEREGTRNDTRTFLRPSDSDSG